MKNFKKFSQNGENEIANIPQIGVNDLETLVKQLELENQCLKLENAILNDFCKRNNLHWFKKIKLFNENKFET